MEREPGEDPSTKHKSWRRAPNQTATAIIVTNTIKAGFGAPSKCLTLPVPSCIASAVTM